MPSDKRVSDEAFCCELERMALALRRDGRHAQARLVENATRGIRELQAERRARAAQASEPAPQTEADAEAWAQRDAEERRALAARAWFLGFSALHGEQTTQLWSRDIDRRRQHDIDAILAEPTKETP